MTSTLQIYGKYSSRNMLNTTRRIMFPPRIQPLYDYDIRGGSYTNLPNDLFKQFIENLDTESLRVMQVTSRLTPAQLRIIQEEIARRTPLRPRRPRIVPNAPERRQAPQAVRPNQGAQADRPNQGASRRLSF